MEKITLSVEDFDAFTSALDNHPPLTLAQKAAWRHLLRDANYDTDLTQGEMKLQIELTYDPTDDLNPYTFVFEWFEYDEVEEKFFYIGAHVEPVDDVSPYHINFLHEVRNMVNTCPVIRYNMEDFSIVEWHWSLA